MNQEEEFKKLAIEMGFTKAECVPAADISFDADLRRYCEMNLCGSYGNNYACPPDCGTPAQMEEKVRGYQNALVVQSITKVNDIRDDAETKKVKKEHNKKMLGLVKELQKAAPGGTAVMAGPCALCDECQKKKGEKCRFPERISSCLSAYCIKAQELSQRCGMVYWCPEGEVAFFSIYLWNEEEGI